TVAENGSVTVSGSFADAGSQDGHTLLIDWGKGEAVTRVSLAAGTYTFSATHQYLDDNPTGTAADSYTVRVRVLDNTAALLAADLKPAAADTVVRFEGTTGGSLGTLVAANASGISGATDISGIAVGPDGLLYVAYGTGATPVVRYEPTTGVVLDTFTPGGAFFDQNVNKLAFSPAGNLYL